MTMETERASERRATDEEQQEEERSMWSAGKGRRDETGHSGVYPMSAPEGASPDAELKGEAAWGQGDRGAAGYDDHGDSEVMTIPPDSSR
jgi:hypothetical protein